MPRLLRGIALEHPGLRDLRRAAAAAGVLGELLARAPPGDTVSCVVPVPLHASRLCQRGFNQALELLRLLAWAAGLRIDWRTVRRTRMTVAQSGLSAVRRTRNVPGAFAVTRRFDGERVAIFDDVVTAGELARAMRQAGAREVLLWACARAPSPRH